jgi:hypothetical protein
MKPKYFIGDIGFKSKEECKKYTRKIISGLGCCNINKDHIHFNFFENLLKNHPEYDEKKGDGIDYFFIIPNPLVSKFFQTMIKRVDGSKIDFSWIYCCEFKERTINDHLIMSMRTAIKDEVINFKQSQINLTCNSCKNDNLLYENYHVDHDNLSFKTLKDNFLSLTSKPIPTSFGDCKKYNFTIFKEEDEDFKQEWIKYHNDNCKLQILCKGCNLNKK